MGSPASGTACQAGLGPTSTEACRSPERTVTASRRSAASSTSTRSGTGRAVADRHAHGGPVARSTGTSRRRAGARCPSRRRPTWASRQRSTPSTRTPLTMHPELAGVGPGGPNVGGRPARPRRSGRRTPCGPTRRPGRRRPRCRPPAPQPPGLDERVGVDQAHEVDAVEVAQGQVVGDEPAVVVVADEPDAGNSATMRSLPSVEALSTTTRSSRSGGQSSADSASRHRARWSPPFQLRTTRRTNGAARAGGALGNGGRGRRRRAPVGDDRARPGGRQGRGGCQT